MSKIIKKKHSLENCDIEDEVKVQEIKAARTPMKKNTPGKCVQHVIKDLQKQWIK